MKMADGEEKGAQDSPGKLPGLVRLDGVNWPWMVTRETLDAVKVYDVWEDDVWVTSFAKAGTHWTLEIVNLILVDGHEHKVNRAQQALPAEFDLSQTGGPSPRPARPGPEHKEMEKWKAPRAIMSHLTEERFPSQIYQGKGKVIYVIRNPKDLVVSKWHFIVPWNLDPRYEDWNYFFQDFLAGNGIFGSWFDHVLNFWNKHRYDKNFLFMKYEDMKRDTKGAVIKIADFLGKQLSKEAIDRVVEFSSLQSMKKRFYISESPRSEYIAPSSSTTVAAGSAPSESETSAGKKRIGTPLIIRKGVVGNWKSQITVAQNEALDALFKERMAGSGLEIQFV